MSIRKASHAGSWYSDSGNLETSLFLCLNQRKKKDKTSYLNCLSYLPFLAKELGRQLDGWLDAASFSHGPARAIIAP